MAGVSMGTVGRSGVVSIDLTKFHFGVGIVVTIPSGTTATYNVEVTGDNITGGAAPTNWNQHDFMNGLSASANGNLAYPVTAVSLNVLGINGTSPVVMQVIQAVG